MASTLDYLNAMSPYQGGADASPGQMVAANKLAQLSNPFGFEAGVHYGQRDADGFAPLTQHGMNHLQSSAAGLAPGTIEDNSQLIGQSVAQSQGQAKQSQDAGASADGSTLRRGRLGAAFDKMKDDFKDTIVGQGNHTTEAQIHAGINSQSSGANPAFATIGAGNGTGGKSADGYAQKLVDQAKTSTIGKPAETEDAFGYAD